MQHGSLFPSKNHTNFFLRMHQTVKITCFCSEQLHYDTKHGAASPLACLSHALPIQLTDDNTMVSTHLFHAYCEGPKMADHTFLLNNLHIKTTLFLSVFHSHAAHVQAYFKFEHIDGYTMCHNSPYMENIAKIYALISQKISNGT